MARYCVGASMEIDWGEEEPQARWDWCLAKRVFAYFRPYWRYGVAAIACLAAGAALALVPAVVTKAVVDALSHTDRAFGRVLALILLGVGASLVGGLVGTAESWCSATISQRIMFDLREQLFDRLLRQSVGFFTRSRTGDVMSRIGNDVNAVEDVVADTILGMVYNLFVVPSTLALMVVLNWRLTVLALLLMPLALLPSRRVAGLPRPGHRRHGGHLHRVARRTAGRLDRVAWQPQRQHHRVAGAVSPHLRGAGPDPRGRRHPGRPDAGARPGRGRLRPGHLRLRARPAPRAPGGVVPGRARPARRAGGADRGGQVDRGVAGPSVPRPAAGPGPPRRPRRPRAEVGVAGRPHRHRLPGHLPVPRLDRRPGAGRGGQRRAPAPVHHLPARRVRHGCGGAWPPAVGWGEAAGGDRAGDPQGPADPAAGRGHLPPGHRLRAAHPGGAEVVVCRADHHRDRPPPVDGAGRRPDPGDRRRAAGRAGHPPGAAGPRWPVRRAVRAAVPGPGTGQRTARGIREEEP